MSSSNGNGSSRDQRAKQEKEISQQLFHVFQKRYQEITAGGGGGSGDNGSGGAILNENELALLKNLVTIDMSWTGIGTSMIVFWTMRGLRSRARLFASRQQRQPPPPSSGFSTDGGKTFSPFHNIPQSQPHQAPPPPPPSQQNRLRHVFGLILDATFGALVGTSVTIYLMDRPNIIKTFVETPLQAGQSGISDEFCPPLLKEYQKVLMSQGGQQSTTTTTTDHDDNASSSPSPNPLFTEKGSLGTYTILPSSNSNNNNNGNSPSIIMENPENDDLKILIGFIKNCQKRHALEQKIRNEKGLSASDPVLIPEPGVNISIDDGNFSDNKNERYNNDADPFSSGGGGHDGSSNDHNSDFVYGSSNSSFNDDDDNNNNWANEDVSSFVSDQEEFHDNDKFSTSSSGRRGGR